MMKKRFISIWLAALLCLSCLSFSVTAQSAEIAINETTFPNEALRNYVGGYFDTDFNGMLSESEIAGVTTVLLDFAGADDLSGMEIFTNLEELYCYFNGLAELDVSMFPHLRVLSCARNGLTELDVSRNPALEKLYCSENELVSLDLSNNPALTVLDCSDNPLTALDLSHSTALTELWCDGIPTLQALSLAANPALVRLSCKATALTQLDLSLQPALRELSISPTHPITVVFSDRTMLEGLVYPGISHEAPHPLSLCGAEAAYENGILVSADGAVTETVDFSAFTDGLSPARLSELELLFYTKNTEEWYNPYFDIPDDHPDMDAIRCVTEQNYMIGTAVYGREAVFSPDMLLTRAQYVTVLGRMAGIDVTQYTHNGAFSDVKADDWFAPYAAWAYENGIVEGYDNGCFGVNDTINTEQALLILARFSRYQGTASAPADTAALDAFTDADSVSAWAYDAVAWAIAGGIYTPVGGRLVPDAFVTRLETAVLVYRYGTS